MALTRPKYSQIYDTDWKQSVELASTTDVGNLILGNTQPNSIDGVTVLTNYRVLVKDQTNGAQNGIYLVRNAGTGSNGWWTRSLDAAQSNFVTAGLTVAVISGDTNGGKEYRLTTPDPITLGTTILTFVDPNAAAGAGGGNTQVQFNDASVLNGSAGFTFNKFTNVATVSGNIVSTSGYFLGNGSQLTGITTDATSIQSGNSSVKTYSSSNVAISVGSTANTVVFTASNTVLSGNIIPGANVTYDLGSPTQNWRSAYFSGNIVSGSILPGANVTYDLGSPTQKWRSAYFSGNTVYIGPESISVSNDGTWTFTSNGGNTTMSSSSAMGNVYMDKTNGYMGFNDTSPDFVYDFNAPSDGGELLHIETGVGTQAWFGAQNFGGLRYAAGVDQDYVFSGSRNRPDHYVLMTAGMVRANIHGNTGNVIFSNSISVTNDVSTKYLGTQEFRSTASNITVRSDITLLGTKLFGAGQLAIGTEDVGEEKLFVTGGETYLDGDVTITGNLFVNGNTTTFNANNLTINDSMIFMADFNPADTLDIGFVSSFTDAVRYQHTGFVRDASDGTWKLFANVVPEPTTTVDFTDANYGNILVGNIQATNFTGNSAFLTGYINTTGNLSVGGNFRAAPNAAAVFGAGIAAGTANVYITGGTSTLTVTSQAHRILAEAHWPRWGIGTAANGYSFFNIWPVNNVNLIESGSRPLLIGFAGGAGGNVLYMDPVTGTTVLNPTTASTNASTGALRVSGGVGIGGNLNVNGVTVINDQTQAASATRILDVNNGVFDVAVLPRVGGGSYNPIAVTDDSMILFGGGSGQGSGNLVITNWNVNNTGIRIVGNTGLVQIPGQLTINANNSPTAIANGGTNGVGNIGASGQGFNTVFARATSAQYADLAEIYIGDVDYDPGTVVIFGGEKEVTISTQSHDTRIAGVVSTNPAYLMNSTETGVPVALQGRVPCQVLGPVEKGDRLVASQHPGVAQKLNIIHYQPGCIIGKALEAVDSSTITTIEVVVGRL